MTGLSGDVISLVAGAGMTSGVTSVTAVSGESELPRDMTTMTSAIMTSATMTEKPYEDYLEVKVAVLIDRIYIPLLVLFGVAGNALCFATLVFSSLRNTSTCVYMAAIAVLDAVILVLDLCVLVRGYTGHTEFYVSNDWTCGFHNFLFYFSIHFDVLLLLAMTVDRYIVVRFPLKAQALCTSTSALKATTAIGLFSFALNFQIFFTRRLGPTGNIEDPLKCWYPDPDVDFFMRRIYTWIDATLYSFLPCLALLALNVLIIRRLRASLRFSRQFTEKAGGGSSKPRLEIEGDTVHSGVCTSATDVSYSEVTVNVGGGREGEGGGGGAADDASSTTNPPSRGAVSTISGKSANGTSRKKGGGSSGGGGTTSTNITVMLLLVSFAFLLLTSPVVIVLLYKRYYWLPTSNGERARARLTHAFVDNLMYTNHAVNFVLYSVSGRRFRDELRRLLRRACPLFCR